MSVWLRSNPPETFAIGRDSCVAWGTRPGSQVAPAAAVLADQSLMKKSISILAWLCLSLVPVWAKEPGLLPPVFNGWEINQQSVKTGSDPAAVDPADFAVLQEYGFSDFENATYTRNGRSMQVKAARFNDTSGAFGAYTFYVQPQMQPEQIGDQASSNDLRVLFYRGNILVEVNLDRVTAMAGSDLRALADALPHPHGSASVLPSVLQYLPKRSLLPNTMRYFMGPVALDRQGVPIPANLVDFSKSPDVALAKYRNSAGDAALTLVEYPTPQIAAERLRAWQAALPGSAFHFRRSGPILAAVSGDVDQGEAQSLLASVNYDADVTWNQPTRPNRLEDRGAFLIAEFLLIGVVLGIGLIGGLAYGSFRIILKKVFPNRGFDRPEEVEIVSLNLKGRS
jgi:hypothetical protein